MTVTIIPIIVKPTRADDYTIRLYHVYSSRSFSLSRIVFATHEHTPGRAGKSIIEG